MRVLLIFCGIAPVMALAAPVSFKSQIAPILRVQCQSCHGAEEAKGDYRVDSFAEVMRALEDEPARVLAKKPDESLFLELLSTSDADERMPQKADALPAKQIALIRQWIAEGAKFDGNDPKATLAEIIPARKHAAAPAVYPRALPITALALSPDGKTIAASGLREITLWNLEGKLVRRIPNMAQRTFALAWLPDGETLLAGGGIPGELGEVRAFTQDGKLRAVVHQATDVVLDVQLDANTTRLAVADAANAVTLYSAADFSRQRRIENHSDWVMAVTFSPDNRYLASASRDRTAKIFDLKTGDVSSTYGGHKTPVQGVAFRPDGKAVYTADRAGSIHLWETPPDIDGKRFGAKKVAEIGGLGADVFRLVRHGNELLSHGSDGHARFFEVATRKSLRTMHHENGWVMSAAWHAPSTRLVTGAHDGTVCVWDAQTGKLLKRFNAWPHARP